MKSISSVGFVMLALLVLLSAVHSNAQVLSLLIPRSQHCVRSDLCCPLLDLLLLRSSCVCLVCHLIGPSPFVLFPFLQVATLDLAKLHFPLGEGSPFEDKPGCVACNAAQIDRCWSNLKASEVFPVDGTVATQDLCELQPAMQAFWHCLKACAGDGACSAADLAKLGVEECMGNPIPCNLGGCPKCPVGFRASDVMTWGCEQKGVPFEDFGCTMDCGVNVCGNCPPDLPHAQYEHDLEECHLKEYVHPTSLLPP